MYHPTRGGTRGGVDQFTWESVKSDKYRENYLGHSLKAPVGRWQKGKDLTWYAKDKGTNDKQQSSSRLSKEELIAIKQAEEMALLAALGHKPVARNVQPLSKEDLADALKRGQTERDELNVERVEGVGVGIRMQAPSAPRKGEGVTFVAPDTRKPSGDDKAIRRDAGSDENVGKKTIKKHKKKKHHQKIRSKHETSSESESHEPPNKKKKSSRFHVNESIRDHHRHKKKDATHHKHHKKHSKKCEGVAHAKQSQKHLKHSASSGSGSDSTQSLQHCARVKTKSARHDSESD